MIKWFSKRRQEAPKSEIKMNVRLDGADEANMKMDILIQKLMIFNSEAEKAEKHIGKITPGTG